ncbi:MAG: hypothetical protein H7Y17_16690 [Chlorobia bacterium]|nr:hypothetical protein [Fimbriimonadaceae bacterium]
MIEVPESRIVVERIDAKDIKMRDLYLQVDDLAEETLMYRESIAISVIPGLHRISATNRVNTKTLDIDVIPGETVGIAAVCIPSKSILAMLMVLTGIVPYKIDLWKH